MALASVPIRSLSPSSLAVWSQRSEPINAAENRQDRLGAAEAHGSPQTDNSKSRQSRK